jgi:CspA family cold shock protein
VRLLSRIFLAAPVAVLEVFKVQGQVNKLKTDRGFGFIRSESGEDVFFHSSAVADGGFDLLREGQAVTFETESSPRGPRARDVRPA